MPDQHAKIHYLKYILRGNLPNIKIYYQVSNGLHEMLADQYANYFCPKLFTALEQDDRIRFLNQLKPFCMQIAISKVGTYPLQIIIESIQTNQECIIIIEAFANVFLDACFVLYNNYIFIGLTSCTCNREDF
jgi:hypothetical protein